MANDSVKVFALKQEELQAMMRAHAASVQKCIDEINGQMPTVEESQLRDVMAPGSGVKTKRDIYLDTIKSLEIRLAETLFSADRVAEGEHRMSGAELLAFKRIYGDLVVDTSQLGMAPASAPVASSQAERALGSTLVQVPRLVLPPGALER